MTRDPDTKLTRKPPLGPSPAGLGLQVSVSPSCLETKDRILQRMWDGKTQENLTQALHKVVHFYRIKEKPKADSDPGLGSQCQETLASPWGSCTMSSHQAIGVGVGWEGASPTLMGVCLSSPFCLEAKRTKVSPSSTWRKGACPILQGHGEDGSPARVPKGTVHIKWGQQKRMLKLCSGYLSPTSPHHHPDPRGQLGGLAQSSH